MGFEDPERSQRGVVFLLLFTILMEQLRDYEAGLTKVQDIPEDYMIIMQIIFSSSLTNPAVEANPAIKLLQQYAEQRFTFRTIPIRFEARASSETGKFNQLGILIQRPNKPYIVRVIDISTSEFEYNRLELYEAFT